MSRPSATSVVDDEAECARLRVELCRATQENEQLSERVRELEEELEFLSNSVVDQQLRVLDGYLVSVRQDEAHVYIAHCPTLRAVADGVSPQAAVSSLREAMAVAIEGHRSFGRPIPPQDTPTQCLD